MADIFSDPTIDDIPEDDAYGGGDGSDVDDTEETRAQEDAETAPSRAMVRASKGPEPLVQLVGIYDFSNRLKVRRIINGNPVEPFREPTAEEAAIVLAQGVRTMNTTGMAGAEPPPRPFYKHPVFIGAALLGLAGAGYYAYSEYVKPALGDGTRTNGDDDDDADDDYDDEE